MRFRLFLFGALATIVAGSCGSNGSSGSSPKCTTDADCGTDALCGFAQAEGCSADGACYPKRSWTCDLLIPACACDGTLVDIGGCTLPGDVASKPLAPTQACMGDPWCDSDDDCWFVPPPPCNLTTHRCG